MDGRREPQLSLVSVPDSISSVFESEAPSGGPDRDSEAPSGENDGGPDSEALSRERGVFDRAERPSVENQEKNARSYAAVTVHRRLSERRLSVSSIIRNGIFFLT